jgi:hypothetical protein
MQMMANDGMQLMHDSSDAKLSETSDSNVRVPNEDPNEDPQTYPLKIYLLSKGVRKQRYNTSKLLM